MKNALPAKAKMTALVCSGRRRPKDNHSVLKLKMGLASCSAISSPASMPTTPQMSVANRNLRTMSSSYENRSSVAADARGGAAAAALGAGVIASLGRYVEGAS